MAAPATPVAAVRTVRVFAKKDEKEPERDEDGLYYGTLQTAQPRPAGDAPPHHTALCRCHPTVCCPA